ncbi:indolepyruvate ferredoxin oxidoreductase subunit alpha [Spirochaetia bacterium]|nr:indolepyruvate ferredoxin oxidoreductase subunit alpha [Spirochaetia bacterium]
MGKRLLMGNEAIALGALRSGVDVVTGYPGTPSTEILETIVKEIGSGDRKIHVEWSVNEKTALEVAAGAACAGGRALVTMKQVGLNVASDPLMSLNYLGVAGALVVAAADDPGPISSQTEQDTRRFGAFAKIAVFDPATPDEAYLMIADAFACSEKYHRPVIFRPTTRVCHSYASVEMLDDLPRKTPLGFDKAGGRWVIFPSLAYRNHLQIEKDLINMADEFSTYKGNILSGAGKLGIAAGGVSWAYTKEILSGISAEKHEQCKLFKASTVPFPDKLALEFLSGLDEVLVIEELDPVIENELVRLCGLHHLPVKIRGKNSGDMPKAGENSLALIEKKLKEFFGDLTPSAPAPDLPPLPVRPPVLCAGCPHRNSFLAVKEAVGEAVRNGIIKKAVYSGDIGCYTLGNAQPLDMVDTCLCMGAGITMAQGINRIENDTVNFAFIGDSTFFHTGIPGVINAVYNHSRIIIVVLDNSTTAMTGNQVHPGIGKTVTGGAAEKISISAILNAVGVRHITGADTFDFAAAKKAAADLIPVDGVRALILKGPCIAVDKSTNKTPCEIIGDSCTGCGLCVKKTGCPALSLEKNTRPSAAVIDPALCTGCGLCKNFCASGAITGGRP